MKANRTEIRRVAVLLAIVACVQAHSPQLHSAEDDSDTDAATVILVAPDGDDTGDGSKRAPLATIAAAQQEIRKLKAAGGVPQRGVVVEMRGGRYRLASPIDLTSEDSGTAFVSMAGAVLREGLTASELMPPGDTDHLSADGIRLWAALVAAEFGDRGWLDDAAEPEPAGP